MKRLYLLITLTALPMLIGAQEFWAGGYTESLDTIVNGRMLIKAMPDTVVFEPFDSPVQFESTMAGVFDEAGEVPFYTNGCHLYDQNHQILAVRFPFPHAGGSAPYRSHPPVNGSCGMALNVERSS